MGVARATRPCTRCGEIKPPEDFVPRGRTCAACRAVGPPTAHRNLPRHCLRCHELKAPDAFPWGDGRKATRKGRAPKFRRRRGICQACIDRETREREARTESRRATWTKRGRLVRRCSRCGEIKDLERDFYIIRRNPRSEYGYHCKPCTIARVSAVKRQRMQDPVRAEAERVKRRRWQREWRERNPEAYRAAYRRWAERMKADPQRHARHLEACRLAWRLKRERDGADLSTVAAIKAQMPRDREFGRLPAKPLADVIERHLRRMGVLTDQAPEINGSSEKFLHKIGVEPRSVRAWRNGERQTVQFDLADTALTRLGLLWFDVWPPSEYPEVALQLEDELSWSAGR